MVENIVKLVDNSEGPGKIHLINQHSTNCCNQVMHHCLLDTDPTYMTTYNFTYNVTLSLP